MSDTEDVARRFVALWGDYLTALAADPKTAEPVRRWLGLIAAAIPDPPAREPDTGRSRSPSHAAAAAGTSPERDPAMAQLARRLDELEGRIAALERPRRKPAASARKGIRRTRR